MSTINAILEAQADGTVHVPIPEALRHSKIRVVATLEAMPDKIPVDETVSRYGGFGALKGMIEIMPDFDEPLDCFR